MLDQMRRMIPLLSAIFDDQDVYFRKSNEIFLTSAGTLKIKALQKNNSISTSLHY